MEFGTRPASSAGLSLRLAYEQRNTSKDFVVSPFSAGSTGVLALSNGGCDSYREFQVAGRYRVADILLNASYVRSRAFGDLNDLNQFFGNLAQPVIQPDARGRLSFDAPNRFLFWGSFPAPWKLTVVPVYDLHTGFPYSVENQFREYVGPRNVDRFPRFSSFDLQVSRRIMLHVRERISTREWAGESSTFSITSIHGTYRTISTAHGLADSSTPRGENTAANLFWSFEHEKSPCLTALFLISASAAVAADNPGTATLPTADEIVSRMALPDLHRQSSIDGYAGMRRYVLDNQNFHKRAEMLVQVQGDPDGTKHFEVVSEDGWKSAHKHVLRKMLESEARRPAPSCGPCPS